MSGQSERKLLTMGRLGAPYGVKGWMKVHSHTSPPENILQYSPWWLWLDGAWQALSLREGRPHGKGLVARLEGYEDPESVRPLVGAEIAIERDRLQEPGEGSYYWADLIGIQVVNREGCELGRVDHLIDNGVQDVLVIRGEREHLIPFVPERYIDAVDLAAGRITVDWQPDY